MIAKDLISSQLLPLQASDTGEQAMTMMSIYHVKHLPLVDDHNKVAQVLSEEDILKYGMENELDEISSGLEITVQEKDHLFDVLAKIAEHNLTSVPVVDDEDQFVGIISQEELLQHYANGFSFKEPGSIIVLEMKENNYSLAEISRLVEGEHASILSSQLTKVEKTDLSLVTLKVNKKDISKIVATLERFDYLVKASFTEDDYPDILKDRYDSLMNYLNV